MKVHVADQKKTVPVYTQEAKPRMPEYTHAERPFAAPHTQSKIELQMFWIMWYADIL